jgi:two-component system OmpR family sensor kinase
VRRVLSFRARLTLQWTVLFSLLLAVASLWIYLGIRASFFEYLDEQLRTLAATEITSAVDSPESRPHLHELPVRAFAGAPFTRKRVQVFDVHGGLVATSNGFAGNAPLVDAAQITAGLDGRSPLTTVWIQGAPYRVVVLRTLADGQQYAIAVAVDISNIAARLTRIRWLLVLVWLVSTGATGWLGFALASTALRPVRRMTDRALTIVQDDLNARLEPSPLDDEIGRMTQALNALIERLHTALQANRRFAADAAHELRGPVTAIAGEAEVALRRPRSADDYRDTLARIDSRASALTALISDLLVLVRAQEGAAVAMRPICVSELLHDGIARLMPLARARHVSITHVGTGVRIVHAEPRLLARAIDNVLENAVKYNRQGGTIVISTTFEPAAPGARAGRVTIRVSDTGIGVPEANRQRIFERFYRVDHSRSRHTGGSGLGLAIAREVLALFNGRIRVEHSSDAGTTIAIELPGSAGRMSA